MNSLQYRLGHSTKKAMTDSAQYNRLLPLEDGEESEDEWTSTGNTSTKTQADVSVPDVKIHDTDVAFKQSIKNRQNETEYQFSSKNRRKEHFCSPTRAVVSLGVILLCFGTGYFAGFLTPLPFTSAGTEEPRNIHKRSPNWKTKMIDMGTESCIRLVDADGDGILDIIVGLALGKDVSAMLTEDSMSKFCRDLGMRVPCAGSVVALKGTDGKLLWKADAYAEVFALLCHGIDVNQDGVDDCIAAGRLAEMRAINPRNGELLWEADTKYLNRGWNIYSPAATPDLDNDGVHDIIIAHGGDPTVPAEIHVRHSGRFILVSGRTGKPIGRYMDTPNSRETYMSPVVHERRDGSQYFLLGTGGETVDGQLMAISIPDFYRYVMDLPSDHPVPNTFGNYDQWGFKPKHANGTIEIFPSEDKGVMVPPVLVDMNRDGVKDILVSSFNGVMILYCGETLEVIWKIKFEDRESYSSPAPGYFNDDDVLDFMVHWSVGAWPYYNTTDTVIIDGRDGAILWNLTTNKYDVSSDLTARTSAFNRDVFLFRAQGRHGYDPRNTGAVHGATGIQRIINKRLTRTRRWELQESLIENGDDAPGILLPESHFRSRRAVIDKDYVECDSDQTVFLAELFALDRTVARTPIKLWERGAEKYYYKLTADDRELVKEAIARFGKNHTMTENEVPWSRGRRAAKEKADDKPFCSMVQPDERTTGAIGDVDGDGKLDVIVNLVSVGILRDEYARYVKMRFEVEIFKIGLEDALMDERYTPINVTLHDRVKWVNNENKMTDLKFLSTEKQTWAGYMGSDGHSKMND